MKAKIIKTGEIINFLGSSIEFGTATWVDSNNVMHQGSLPEIQLLEQGQPIDWEERRWIAAKDILCAFESNPNENMFVGNPDTQVRNAIMFADELIKQLKNNE